MPTEPGPEEPDATRAPSQTPPEPWVGARMLPESRRWLVVVGVVVIVLTVVGLVGVLPLVHAGQSVSERVSKKIGRSVSCTAVGKTELAGTRPTVYRCAPRSAGSASAGCYSVVDGTVYGVYALRELGC